VLATAQECEDTMWSAVFQSRPRLVLATAQEYQEVLWVAHAMVICGRVSLPIWIGARASSVTPRANVTNT
jgi:hypothetical protein